MEIRPTFWGVLLVLAAGGAGQWIWGEQVPFFSQVIYLGLFLMAASFIWAAVSVRGFSLKREARGLRQPLGQIFEERFEIQNHFPFPRLWLEIRDESNLPGTGGSRILSAIGARERRTYSAYTFLQRRGEYLLGPTWLVSGDPFGLFVFKSKILTTKTLLVLPCMFPLRRFPSAQGLLPGGKAQQRRTLEVTPHAAGVREYYPGDALNKIHWPTTVRRDRLMVKEFDQDPQADVWVVLDAEKSAHIRLAQESAPPKVDQLWLWRQDKSKISLPPDTFEYAVSAAASVSGYFLRQGQSVALTGAGQCLVTLAAERGERQLGKILETLALLKSEGNLSLLALVERQLNLIPRGSTVVLVTATCHPSILVAIDVLSWRDMKPVVVLIDPASFGGEERVEGILPEISIRGVPVVRLVQGIDLKQALEEGFGVNSGR